MASSIDFVVKNGLQVSTNIVVGTYTLNNTPISNGAIISGNVGIGTFNPTAQLHVYGNIKVSNTATSGGIIFPDGTFQNTSASGSTVYLSDDTTTNAVRYLTFTNATTGILTSLNTSSTKLTYNPLLASVNLTGGNLTVSNSTQVGNLSVTNTTAATSTTTGALVVAGGVGVTGNIYVGSNMFVNSNVGIGTTIPVSGYILTVNGGLAATTKSFVINHPTKPGMKLQYASLEGPENGVYIRGKLEDDNTIVLPDYWRHLVDPETITVHLTPYGSAQNLYVKDIDIKSITVASTSWIKSIKCFYTVYAERKDVPKLTVEI